ASGRMEKVDRPVYNRYRNISGLSLRDQDSQVDALLYTMGSGAEDLLAKLQMTPAELSSYSTVEKKLTEHFVPKNNVIYERFLFNRRVQQPGESVDTFITDLFKLAETCEFAQLKDDLIRDRIVVGLS